MRFWLVVGAIAQSLCAQGSVDVVVSQIYGGGGNSGAPFRSDYIELFNRSKTAVRVDGWSVQYASAGGTSWQVTALRGTIAPQRYFLVQQAAGTGGGAALPFPDVEGGINMSSTAGQVAVVRSTTALGGDRLMVSDFVEYSGLNNTTAALRRGGGCVDTDNPNDFERGAPFPRNSQAQIAVDCERASSVPTAVDIANIQGLGSRSPLEGRYVSTQGVVIGRKSNGFWMQSTRPDANPVTSEGVFVFTRTAPPASYDHALVEVTGTVEEFESGWGSLTEITDPKVRILAPDQSPPAAIELESGVDWERYEGMRVSAALVRAVSGTLGRVQESTNTATSTGVFYAVLPGQPRPYRTGDDSEQFERLRIDTRAQGGPALDIPTGTTIGNVLGPLDWVSGTFGVAQEATTALRVRTAGRPPVGALVNSDQPEFTVASMNLQRFYDDRDDSGNDVVVQTAAYASRVANLAATIRDNIGAPAIIGVQEAENLRVLEAIGRAAGDYEAHLVEGNDPSGIDVGLLTARGHVQVIDVVQEGKTARLDGGGVLWDRPPLVARLRVDGVPLTAIVVHLRSMIGEGSASVDTKRAAQAEALGAIVRTRAAAGEELIVLGDFNAPPFDRLMQSIRAGLLLNLTDTLPPAQNYTYVHEGVAQALDHILITPGLRERLSTYSVRRFNADYPEVWRNQAPALTRSSDHDYPVARFVVAPQGASILPARLLNGASFLSGAVAPLEVVSIFWRGARMRDPGSVRVTFDDVPARLLFASQSQINAVVPVEVAGRGAVTVKLSHDGGTENEMRIAIVDASPGIFPGAILNQDYSINSTSNPAERGSIVMMWGTGLGLTLADSVSARVGGRPAEVVYAGQAPGFVEGAIQINVRIPEDAPAGELPLTVFAGDQASGLGRTIAVR